MKIAVLYSGQIRGDSYKDNIWTMQTLLPSADFYFTAWKGDGNHAWIDRYFDEPHIGYNCERYIHELSLKQLRKAKEKYGHVPEEDDEFNVKKHRRVLKYEFRKLGRDRIKQHIAHALAFEQFCTDMNYDVVIRVRYDLRFESCFGKKEIEHMINLCHRQKKPVSIGYMGEYPERLLNELKPETLALGDVLICHRGDMFDSQYVFDLVKDKKLKSAEGGWFQILCEPYNTNAWCANRLWAWIERERWR